MALVSNSNKDLLETPASGNSAWYKQAWRWLVKWSAAHLMLFEALLIAISFHVLLFPIFWVAGWALPWPKAPDVTMIVEFDLRGWPNVVKPKKIFELRLPKNNSH